MSHLNIGCRDFSVSAVDRIPDRYMRNICSGPGRGRGFVSSLHCQDEMWYSTSLLSSGWRESLPRSLEWQKHETKQSAPYSTEVENEGRYSYLYSSLAWLRDAHRNNFIFIVQSFFKKILASNGNRLESWIKNHLDGNNRSLIRGLPRHSPWGTEENEGNI